MNSKALVASLILTVSVAPGLASSQTLELDLRGRKNVPTSGHLVLGGKSANGDEIAVNSHYISRGGRPIFPVMGEMHYCRVPEQNWEEEILKCKAGGVTCIPTYVFWNVHEEKEGEWTWTGSRNLRAFVQLCAKHSIDVIVRIGPFGHGEMRNGAFPDWLLAKPLEVRTNDSLYLEYVEKLYKEIAKQLDGLLFKDGGPVIGVQIENEYQHSSAPWYLAYEAEQPDRTVGFADMGITRLGLGEQHEAIPAAQLGDEHMMTLKRLAERVGLVVPLYTATGWGMAAVLGNEGLPVTACYTYPTWTAHGEMSRFCLMNDIRKMPDYAPVRYDAGAFPALSAEMGAGIQVTYPRRAQIHDAGAEAMTLRAIASGANGVGYYMYRGGSTPTSLDGRTFLSEEPSCPKISYDFQAPIGEYGIERESYSRLRLLHHFLREFGSTLAPMMTAFPSGVDEIDPADRERVRWCVREKDGSGFVFLVNFQDHDTARHDQRIDGIKLETSQGTVVFPKFTLAKDTCAILPFNLKLDDAVLEWATAQPMCKAGGVWYFVAIDGVKPEFSWKEGKSAKVEILSREDALHATKIGEQLIVTDAMVVPHEDGEVELQSFSPDFSWSLYPGALSFSRDVPKCERAPDVREISPRRYAIKLDVDCPSHIRDWYLELDYTADVALAFLDSRLIADNFWVGKPWQIGLGAFAEKLRNQEMNILFRPLRYGAPFLDDIEKEKIPDLSRPVIDVKSIRTLPLYRIIIDL